MKERLNGRADEIKRELEEKTLALARTEEKVLVLEAEREDIAFMIKDIRNDKVLVVVVVMLGPLRVRGLTLLDLFSNMNYGCAKIT